MATNGNRTYRVQPDDVLAICAAVDGERIDRTAVSDSLESALQAVRSLNDPLTDQIIYLLGGIAGDLRDATARIDARVGRASTAARQVVGAVEDGDARMSADVSRAATAVDPALVRRFGGIR